MTNASIPTLQVCPVCAEPYMVYVCHKMTVRTRRSLPVYGCLSCRSFSNPSGYVEDDRIRKRDLEWHKGVVGRNTDATTVLLAQIGRLGVPVTRIVDIGAGIGTLLQAAAAGGVPGIGYDPNPLTQPYARDVMGVDVRAEYWTPETDCGAFDLMTCVMVLEHIEKPRPLIRDMVQSCIANDAALFLSVPFLDRDRWHFLHKADPTVPNTPFFDNDVHVTHFSSDALEAVVRAYGMRSAQWIRTGLWHGVLARP